MKILRIFISMPLCLSGEVDCRPLKFLGFGRQFDSKRGTAANGAFGIHLAAVSLGKCLDKGQTNASSSAFYSTRIAGLIKFCEYFGQLLFGYTYSGVLYFHLGT